MSLPLEHPEEQAALAALKMISAVARIHDRQLSLRVGIASGPLIGTLWEAERGGGVNSEKRVGVQGGKWIEVSVWNNTDTYYSWSYWHHQMGMLTRPTNADFICLIYLLFIK